MRTNLLQGRQAAILLRRLVSLVEQDYRSARSNLANIYAEGGRDPDYEYQD